MTIEKSTNSIYQSLFSTSNTSGSTTGTSSFADLLQANIDAAKVTTTQSSNDSSSSSSTISASNSDVEAFLSGLKEKGALAFYQDYNAEKIEKLMEEKKEELTEKLGLSDTAEPPLTGTDREEALANLQDSLDAYRKQLQEKMQAEDKLDQQNTMLGTFLQDLA